MPATNPPVARLQLGQLLRRLREESGKTQDAAAKILECQKPRISKIETGKATISAGDVRLLIELYGADETTGATVTELAREARKRTTARIPDWAQRYVALESIASSIQVYEPELIPGLIQTENYTRAITQAADPERSGEEVDRLVAARTERKSLLRGKSPLHLSAVLNEAALRRTVGGAEVMIEQLRHLREIAELPNVTLQLLPFTAGAHVAMGSSFYILEIQRPAKATVVYLESLTSGDYVDNAAQIERYALAFQQLQVSSSKETETATTLERMIKDLR
ncbi:helix-turn-helix domain-containing protein [Saccharopolyspora phatthalungensis]|uniref:Transcriptional regulator with XRE-family HTH domain n=1 Tax=Saccharopolyspora phatthalungensis TaxID=664693 RepID=A0A840Q654_9PSEU|nr:helix-turn-helix transcriptional regulator [Saccharopolyspora phatthalungensis]MBB5154149.1 transcriptional regulator with XRE-family HTH domain [Saccharopolyspora phatthalungensis]